MDTLETKIKKEENRVLKSFTRLTEIASEKERDALAQAKEAFSDLNKVTETVLQLSRQNSNIKSLELSLSKKRKITAKCDEILSALHEAVQKGFSRATR
jgi:flagellar biosynthesis chaperone FliJ